MITISGVGPSPTASAATRQQQPFFERPDHHLVLRHRWTAHLRGQLGWRVAVQRRRPNMVAAHVAAADVDGPGRISRRLSSLRISSIWRRGPPMQIWSLASALDSQYTGPGETASTGDGRWSELDAGVQVSSKPCNIAFAPDDPQSGVCRDDGWQTKGPTRS